MDADGCVTIKRQRRPDGTYYALQVIVSQVSAVGCRDDVPPVIAKLTTLGGNVNRQDRDHMPNRRPLWHWQVTGAQAETFLRAIRPYMIGKADQADVALAYREQAVGLGGPNPNGRVLAEAAYARLRAMKNYNQTEET